MVSTTRNMTNNQRSADVRVIKIEHMILLLALYKEMTEIKQRNVEENSVFRQENKEMNRRLEGTHLSKP